MNAIIILSVTAILILFAGAFGFKKVVKPLCALGLIGAVVSIILVYGQCGCGTWFHTMIAPNNATNIFGIIIVICALIVILLPFENINGIDYTDNLAAIVLFAVCGALCMAWFNNLAILFLGIEIMSISFYLLAGSDKNNPASNEAAMKYFLLGSFATGFLLLGIALIYGATGQFSIQKLIPVLAATGNYSIMLLAGTILLLVGITFKLSAAPLHFWAPDVYEGAPAPFTGLMATMGKVAGIAVLLRVFSVMFVDPAQLRTMIIVMSVLSILIGNITALYQQNLQRMMAYSGISHIGYLLMIFAAPSEMTPVVSVYYAIAYALATLTIFVVHTYVKAATGDGTMKAYTGLGKANPVLALALTVSLLSLTGIPPLVGFMGKFLVFVQAAKGGLIWLVVLAAVASLVSIAYYFKPFIEAWFRTSEKPIEVKISGLMQLVLALLVLAQVILGCVPGIIL